MADNKPSRDIYKAALANVQASRLTDAELIYTPSQIAIAAFSSVIPNVISEWLESKQPGDPSALAQTIEDIKAMVAADGHVPNVESVREVDRRLKLCKNPEKVPGSKAYILRKQEEERIAEEKRHKKAEIQKTLAQEAKETDPFGNGLTEKRGLVDYDDDDDDD